MTTYSASGAVEASSSAPEQEAPVETTREDVLAEADALMRKAERTGNPKTKAEHLKRARLLYAVVASHDAAQR